MESDHTYFKEICTYTIYKNIIEHITVHLLALNYYYYYYYYYDDDDDDDEDDYIDIFFSYRKWEVLYHMLWGMGVWFECSREILCMLCNFFQFV